MNILIMTIPVSLTLGILFLLFFLSAVSKDQFEDLDTPGQLPLSDDITDDETKDVPDVVGE
jgi:cbb3-type cytochrome oxidase maturation protein